MTTTRMRMMWTKSTKDTGFRYAEASDDSDENDDASDENSEAGDDDGDAGGDDDGDGLRRTSTVTGEFWCVHILPSRHDVQARHMPAALCSSLRLVATPAR